mmetsp:Transcript_18175/g.22897  ORF Transcript_18175/g.22897 Transcript_18175/m.22897 type:complete len:451 (-) Transcript_18175:155-1507(-)|eukprot:CAMPEP_0117768560 /NCGR_PEP_ID=MMETSP0947-20121206/22461_1 /TAXON_ID=44440 /ORGANISM="Chattonella subsalsa, Strain CCMP2191" /LENGTH=450 /DNA_ID=CAMNT_0005592791 /DNA_START=11 /DNA_END=1363 /DNA_ORIENTATION=-
MTKKRERDDSDSYDDRDDADIAIKILVSMGVAGAIIGKGGQRVAEIKQKTGAKLYISAGHEFFPTTNERVLFILGKGRAVKDAIGYVMERIEEPFVNQARYNRGDEDRIEMGVTIALPWDAVGAIIGKKWAKLKEIESKSRARIKITQGEKANVYPTERLAMIEGSRRGIERALGMVLERLCEEDPKITQYQNTTLVYSDAPPPRDLDRHDDRGRGFGDYGDYPPAQRNRFNDYPDRVPPPQQAPMSMQQPSQAMREPQLQQQQQQIPAGIDNSTMTHALQLLSQNPSLSVPQAMALATRAASSGSNPGLSGGGGITASGYNNDPRMGYADRTQMDRGYQLGPDSQREMDRGGMRREPGRVGRDHPALRLQSSVTIYVPDKQVGALIGRAGRVVTEINQRTGAVLNVSSKGDYAEGTRDRIVTLRGNNQACQEALVLVNEILQTDWSERF